jgi:multidrug efflux system membrane fusion protein
MSAPSEIGSRIYSGTIDPKAADEISQQRRIKLVTDHQDTQPIADGAARLHQETIPLANNFGKWRMRIVWLVIALAIAVLAVIIHQRKNNETAQSTDQAPVPHIKTASAERGQVGSYIEALGNVTPLATVNLYSQVTGQVDAVHYSEGQIVHKGDSLIDIDPRPYEAQLEEAQGSLQRDTASLHQAEMDLARYKQATADDSIARQTYEDQEQIVEQDRGAVKNDVGQVKYAQVQLSYCHLVSPINGRVGLRLVDPGNTIFSGGSSPIVVVTQLQPISVVFNVAEDYLNQVRSEITRRHGLTVDVLDRSQLTRIATGKLLTLDNQIDTSTGTVRFRGQFDNHDLSLYPNQFVNTRLLVKTLQNVILVPAAAVQHNGTQAFVYGINGGVAKLRPVIELGSEDDRTAISGLSEGDIVAVTGFDKLQDGAHVVVQEEQASSEAKALQQQTGAAE